MGGFDVVTGVFSSAGRHIAELLLERGRSVRTLTRRPPDAGHPLAARVEFAPLRFDDSPLGRDRFDEWVAEHGALLGRTSASQRRRNVRSRV